MSESFQASCHPLCQTLFLKNKMPILKLVLCWIATAATYAMVVKLGILADYGEFQPFIPIDGIAGRRWDEFPIALHSAVILLFSGLTPLGLAGSLALKRESTRNDVREPNHLYLHSLKNSFPIACVFNIIIWAVLPMVIGLELRLRFESDNRLAYNDLLYPIYSGAVVCNFLLWRMYFKKYNTAMTNY